MQRVSGLVVAFVLLMSANGVSAHGWITMPVSRLEMSYHHYQNGMPSNLRYEPQSCNGPNSCGTSGSAYTESPATWQKWYDAAGVAVPSFLPGSKINFSIQITADHGGQSWMMLSCADHIAEDVPWTLLERAQDDRDHHFMPSNPTIYAWATEEAEKTMGDVIKASWVVPEGFSCPNGRGVGRWLWKTGNSCNDANDHGRHTETFDRDEFAKVVHDFAPGAWVQEACGGAPETFITCFDFVTRTTPSVIA